MLYLQALKSLTEHPYKFTMCPEEAAPACGQRSDFLEVESALCIPQHISPSGKTPRASAEVLRDILVSPVRLEDGASERDTGYQNATADGPDGMEDTLPCSSVRYPVGWKVLPARIAISLRLERLEPSRIPRPQRAPPVAPLGSVTRLRVSVAGISLRDSHPGLVLLSERSLVDAVVVSVGWNGYEDDVGTPSQWHMMPWTIGNSAMEVSAKDDLLLDVPRHRNGLVLTVSLGLPDATVGFFRGSNGEVTEEKDEEENLDVLGVARIGWDGLACLRVDPTDYFVDAADGMKTWSRHDDAALPRPSMVSLELASSTSLPVFAAGSPRASTAQTMTTNTKLGGNHGFRSVENDTPSFSSDNRALTQPQCCCLRTAGLEVRVGLRMEESPAFIPHLLAFSPAAAGRDRPRARRLKSRDPKPRTTTSTVALGDFRNPCRMERVPFLRFAWPWDEDNGAGAVETRRGPRRSLVPPRAWKIDGRRRAVAWPSEGISGSGTGTVPVPLPLIPSGLSAGGEAWPGSVFLRKDCLSRTTRCGSTTQGMNNVLEPSRQNARPLFPRSDGVLVEVFDMGPYSTLEHLEAEKIQRVWRQAIALHRKAELWWEWEAKCARWSAAIRVQTCYRAWNGRQYANRVERDAARRGVAAVVIQRGWRWVAKPPALKILGISRR